jgi:ferric-dicitrate binding protein FerR (iron transport regulator)
MDEFLQLQRLVQMGTASPEQRRAYYEMLASGQYDHLIASDLDDALKHRQTPILEEARERIFSKIYNEEVVPAGKTRHLRVAAWIMAAATVVTVSLVGVWLYRSHGTQDVLMAQNEVQALDYVYTGRDFIRLPDGSTAMLNEGSELSYAWGEKGREVQLKGEAYFDIKHDPLRPFSVRTGRIVTRVLGTAFNIKAYPSDKEVRVTVSHGKVSVGDEGKTFGVITPNQELAVNTETNDVSRTDKNATASLEWTSAILILDDVDMGKAAEIIGERYHTKIIFADEAVKSCGVSAKFLNDEKITDVLDMISAAVNITYTIENGQVTISGKGCR